MNRTILLGCLILLPTTAHAARIERGGIRLETVGTGQRAVVRLSVQAGRAWQPVLESAAVPSGAGRVNTLALPASAANGRIRLSGRTQGCDVTTDLTPGEKPGHVRVVSRVIVPREMPLEFVAGAWRFLGGAPDAVWTPNLTPLPNQVVGRHVFRSPGIVVQKKGLAAVLLPDLPSVDRAPKGLPATLNLDVKAAGGPRMMMALQPHQTQAHVYWRHEPGEMARVGKGTVTLAYDLLLTGKAEPRRAYRQVARWWWEKQGTVNLHRDVLPQAVPWNTYARTGIDEYALPVAWREARMDGETVGGVAMNTWGYPNATWFQCWFNDLRSAYGTYLWGKFLQRPELLDKARQTRQLLLHSPQKEGIFPVIYDWDRKQWVGSVAGGSPDLYHTADCSWAAYWLLMWDRDLEKDPASVAFARRYGDYLLSAQKPAGEIPSYIRMDTMQPTDRLVGGAESGASGMFLALLGRTTGEAKYMAGARKVAAYLRREILPENKWYDYETFYSCSGKPESFFDARTGQRPQNNLSIHWAAETFRQLYLADKRPEDLRDGEAVMDYLNLYQQVWSPKYLTFEGFGGYGVQNTDAEWNDARQAQFACTNMDFYRLTGKSEYLERGIAATRAGFATTYMPENAFISPRTYAKMPTGYADENYGHGGIDAPAGPTSWDWGTGSALTSAAYARKYFGDVWVDAGRGKAFGIDGVTADWGKGGLMVRSSVQTVAPVRVRGTGAKLPRTLNVNGKTTSVQPDAWRDGFIVTPVAAPRIRHRAPAILSAENAAVTFEVWPHGPADVRLSVGPRAVAAVPAETEGVWRAVLPVPATANGSLEYAISARRGAAVQVATYATRVVSFGKEKPLWADRFEASQLDPRWRTEVPVSGPEITTGPRGLTIAVPGSRDFNQWIPDDEAPRVTAPVPAGGWSFTALLDTGESPRGGLYQVGLTVELGDNDYAFWGPYTASSVVLERSGQNGLGVSPFTGPMPKEMEVRARRVGDTLWFDWRPLGGAWSAPAPLSGVSPRRVGVLVKTWEPIAARLTVREARLAALD